MSDLGASAEHERRKLEQVALAAAELQRAVAVEQRAREVRDLAVRAARSTPLAMFTVRYCPAHS